MNNAYYIIGIGILILVIIPLINKYIRIKNLKILDWISVEYYPFIASKIKISTKSKFGIVVSSDGKVYKTQVDLLIKNYEISAFCNVILYISGIGWFVYRQQIKSVPGGRVPKLEQVVLKQNVINEISIELEPKEGWEPVNMQKKEYKCLLKVKTIDQIVKHKFTFQVRNQNIQAMQRFLSGQASVVEVPIIRN